MIVNQFRAWAHTASNSGRADGASALARAYLYSDLDEAQRAEALRVLTIFLDDPSPLVRRAMAEAFASAADAPSHILLALADDQPSIAAIVLARSPALRDAELIDCAATADAVGQAAIACRPTLSRPVAAALAEIAAPEALVVLAYNRAAPLPEFSIRRMVERHGDHADLREALLARDDLPVAVRVDLVAATTRALSAFVTGCNWLTDERMKRVAYEAKDKAAIVIADTACETEGACDLVAHLRHSGQLTVGFVFRAILSGKIELFKAAISELSDVPMHRVDGLTEQSRSSGFAALYRKAGLPMDLLPAFRIALKTAYQADWTDRQSAALSRDMIERVITGCEAINSGELDKLLVLLRRFDAEAARDEARILEARDAKAPLALSETPRPALAPLLLTDLDAEDEPAPVRNRAPRREPAFLAVDLSALEAELCMAA